MSTNVDDLTSANWRIRRPVVLTTLGFCAMMLVFITWQVRHQPDALINLAYCYAAIGMSTLGAYIGFASQDAKNVLLSMRPPTMIPASTMVDQYGRPIPAATYQPPFAQPGAPPFVDPANPAQDRPA